MARHLADRRGEGLLVVLDDFEKNVEQDAAGAPRLAADGRGVARTVAIDVLQALLGAVRNSDSPDSPGRVLVTCRYRIPTSGGVRLWERQLRGLADADLTKKTRRLGSGQQEGPVVEGDDEHADQGRAE